LGAHRAKLTDPLAIGPTGLPDAVIEMLATRSAQAESIELAA